MATEPCMLSAQIWTRAMYWSGAQNSIRIYIDIYMHIYVHIMTACVCMKISFVWKPTKCLTMDHQRYASIGSYIGISADTSGIDKYQYR